ncbi:MAG: DUF4886 domain-containing protein [Planctomycetota bacterium]
MRHLKPALALGVLCILLCIIAQNFAQSGNEPDDNSSSLQVLFIGNSYTSQVRSQITAMFGASKYSDAKLEFIAPGGCTLARHLQNGKTVEKIAQQEWDFVVLQEQSQTPAVFREKFIDSAKALDDLIKRTGAKTLFYQTWGRRDGDKQNPELLATYSAMQKALSDAYFSATEQCSAQIAPVGDAWAEIRSSNSKLGEELYARDGSHPSRKGAYLAASVMFAVITSEHPMKVPYNGGLEEEEAKMICSIAFEAVGHSRKRLEEEVEASSGAIK